MTATPSDIYEALTDAVRALGGAKVVGHHGLVQFEADDSGYSHPLPISSEAEAEKLQREFIEAVSRQEKLFAQMRAAGVKVE